MATPSPDASRHPLPEGEGSGNRHRDHPLPLGEGRRSRGEGAPLDFTFELLPRKNPSDLKPGGALPLTLLFRGKPAANVLVVAMSRSDPDKAVRARTDANGRVTLPIAHGGFWLIKAVHMQAAPPDSGVDWESWWASLTFEL